MTDIYIQLGNPKVKEGSSFLSTINYSDTPTTAQYRVDCLTTGKALAAWTDLSVSTTNTITVTATHNAIQDNANKFEKKQLTVQTNQGTTTQTRDTVVWKVENIRRV